MKSDSQRRRGGWNYDEPPVPEPAPRESTRKISGRRPSSAPRRSAAWIWLVLIAGPVVAALLVYYIPKFNTNSAPAHPLSAAKNAPTPAAARTTPLPAIHNSADTECGERKQCSDSDFAGLTDNLRRQWALVPEEIRSKCSVNSTYPTVEHCILKESISWMAKHPDGVAPWINPKNFDPGVMELCKKNPSLALCQKP